jgi:hypothetical protein
VPLLTAKYSAFDPAFGSSPDLLSASAAKLAYDAVFGV